STAGRAPVTGRTCSTHPTGVIQRTQAMPWPMSATIRKKTAAASATPAPAWAARRVGASCEASAPTAANGGRPDDRRRHHGRLDGRHVAGRDGEHEQDD